MNSRAGPTLALRLILMGTAASVILERDLLINLCRFASCRWQITNPCRRLISALTRPVWGAVLWEPHRGLRDPARSGFGPTTTPRAQTAEGFSCRAPHLSVPP